MNLLTFLKYTFYNLASIPSHLYISLQRGIHSTFYFSPSESEWKPRDLNAIPQFILDLHHPWIESNLADLQSRPNVASYLCQVDRAWNINNAIPHNLYENLTIHNYATKWRESNNKKIPGWTEALHLLREIQWCHPALHEASSLQVYIQVHNPDNPPPKELIERFTDLFLQLGQKPEAYPLQSLSWEVPCAQTVAFAEAFAGIKHNNILYRNRNLGVKHLRIGEWSEYMISLFPNLESLTYGHGCDWKRVQGSRSTPYRLFLDEVAAAKAPKIKRLSFTLDPDPWSPGLLEDVLKAMPKLNTLGIGGTLRVDGLKGGDDQVLKTYLGILTKFSDLRHLHLPSTMDIDIGENESEETAEVMEKAGALTLQALPRLESLSIGGYQAKIKSTAPDTKDATGGDSRLFPGVSYDKSEL